MTFNVEIFLNLYIIEMDGTVVSRAIPDKQKIQNFKRLFNDIDIACIQETAIAQPNYTFNSINTDTNTSIPIKPFDPIENNILKKKSICQSHPLAWQKSKYIYGEPSYLANAIYANNSIKCSVDKSNIINTQGLNRCYTSLQIMVNDKPIKIVSVHLIGGRFDDIAAIEDDVYSNEKLNQLKKIMEIDPDIICGDFNTKLNKDEQTELYFNMLMTIGEHSDMTELDIQQYKERWDRWIYIDYINNYLEGLGYESVYKNGTNIVDTNSYGGVVDMIYYKKNKLILIPNSVEIVGSNATSVMIKNVNRAQQIYTPILSDHFPIKAEFQVL
jgi:exonuclease III